MKKVLHWLFLLSGIISGYLLFGSMTEIRSESEIYSESFRALNFWAYARSYPNKNLVEGKFFAAFKEKNNIRLKKPSGLSFPQPWKTIGPHNYGGRTNSLAFNPQNPNTIYAGSASGGLWVSYSAGIGVNAWHYLNTNYPVLGVSSIAIAPNDSNTIYIGTGEVYNYEASGTGAAYRNTRGTYGLGILKTTDGGINWTKSLDWSYNDQRGVWAVKINPLNPNTVWAATTEGTYRSYDAGATWQQVNNVIMAMDLIINPVDTSIVLTGNGNFASTGFGIYRTSDDGNSWNKITSGLPPVFNGKVQLDVYNADPNIMFASIGDGFYIGQGSSWLCKSTDAGITWTITSTTDYSQHQGWYSHDVAVNQSNPDELIIIGIEVYKSTNGGLTVTRKSTGGQILGRVPIGGPEGGPTYTHSDAHVVLQHPTDMNTYYIGTDGGIFRTTDFSESFESCNGSYQTVQFYNGTSSSQTDSLFTMGGLQDNSTVIFDGDLAWIKTIGGDGSWTAIDAANDNILFGSWQTLNILKSTDRGNRFLTITPPGSGSNTAFIAPFKIAYGNSNIMYAGRNVIYRSTNSGSNWSATNGGNTLDGTFAIAMDISYQNSNKVYVATAPYSIFRGKIFRTVDAGSSWVNITGSLPDRFPADIAVDPNDDDIVYVTFYGFDTSHIFKTTNSGTDWNDISDNLLDIPTPAVIVDPNNSDHIYIGTDAGVFVSTNGGGNWQDFNDGLPGSVQAMDLNIGLVNNVLRVMTHGNGAYERKLLSTAISGVMEKTIAVENFRLEQNYPNPFNPTTKINIVVLKSGYVTLKVYDLLGEEIGTLLHSELESGTYEYEFDASGLSSGMYLYRLTSGGFSLTRKMVLMK